LGRKRVSFRRLAWKGSCPLKSVVEKGARKWGKKKDRRNSQSDTKGSGSENNSQSKISGRVREKTSKDL